MNPPVCGVLTKGLLHDDYQLVSNMSRSGMLFLGLIVMGMAVVAGCVAMKQPENAVYIPVKERDFGPDKHQMVADKTRPKNEYNITINYELGMHCTGFDFSYCCVLPPYNSVQAQVIKTATGKNKFPELLESDPKQRDIVLDGKKRMKLKMAIRIILIRKETSCIEEGMDADDPAGTVA